MSTNTSPSPSLSDLVAAPVDLPVGTIVLKIKPLGWYESIDAIDAIEPALGTMPAPPASGGDVDMGPWLGWVSSHRDAVVHFAHLASGQNPEDIEALSPGHLVELLFGLLEINADFFVQALPTTIARVGDRAAALKGRVMGVIASASSMSGSTSSSAATASAS
jgi:hypothetical protein